MPRGLQQPGPSDCLPKTQVSAKLKDDVWRLTPAQCRKVKEGCAPLRARLSSEAPVNGGRNYNGPKVAKFLVG